MPTLTEALNFAKDPNTTAEQLQRACSILNIEYNNEDIEGVRKKLLEHLEQLQADKPVVCLNPKLVNR